MELWPKSPVNTKYVKTKSTFFVGASGSFEEVTVKKWKRFRVLSHKSIGNLTNISDRVIGQRSAVIKLAEILNAVGNTVKLGLAEYKLKRSWWPMFMSLNLRGAFDFTVPEMPVFNPEDLIVSRGKLGATVIAVVASEDSGGAVNFNWDDTLTGYKSENDRMRGIVYNRRNGLYYSPNTPVLRSAENVEYSSPPLDLQEDDILDVWTFFINPGGYGPISAGNSYYTEVTVTA